MSLYYLEKKVRGFGAPAVCRSGVPCSMGYINALGFNAISFLALIAFTLITLLPISATRADRE